MSVTLVAAHTHGRLTFQSIRVLDNATVEVHAKPELSYRVEHRLAVCLLVRDAFGGACAVDLTPEQAEELAAALTKAVREER